MNCCADLRTSDFHCAQCHQTFSGLGLFDRHQAIDYDRTPPVICLPAETLVGKLGLIQDHRGVWGTKAGVKAREGSRTRLALAKSARQGSAVLSATGARDVRPLP